MYTDYEIVCKVRERSPLQTRACSFPALHLAAVHCHAFMVLLAYIARLRMVYARRISQHSSSATLSFAGGTRTSRRSVISSSASPLV